MFASLLCASFVISLPKVTKSYVRRTPTVTGQGKRRRGYVEGLSGLTLCAAPSSSRPSREPPIQTLTMTRCPRNQRRADGVVLRTGERTRHNAAHVGNGKARTVQITRR